MSVRQTVAAAAVTTAFIVACGQGAKIVAGSTQVKSQTVAAGQSATIAVGAADDAVLAGTSLSIPAGALGATTTINVDRGGSELVDLAKKAGPVVLWSPIGTSFSAPVTLSIPYNLPAGAGAADLFVRAVDGKGSAITIDQPAAVLDAAAGTLTFKASTLVGAQSGVHQRCSVATDCSAGRVCLSGECEDAAQADGGAPPAGTCNFYYCTCTPTSGCTTGFACVNGNCQESETENEADAGQQADGGDDNPDGGSRCTSNTDCSHNKTCVAGRCQ